MEIGSEFDIKINHSRKVSPFNSATGNKFYVNFGRAAIEFIIERLIKEKNINQFLIPNYLCDSVLQPFIRRGIKFDFYNVKDDLNIDLEHLEKKINPNQCLFIINYFTIQHSDKIIHFLDRIKNSNIIVEDITHDYFDTEKNRYGHIQVASLRKWLGLPSGAVIIDNLNIINNNIPDFIEFDNNQVIIEKRLYASLLKNHYLKNDENDNLKKVYMNLFSAAEKLLDERGAMISKMDLLSQSLFSATDFNGLFRRRKENFQYLFNQLQDINPIKYLSSKLQNYQVPMGFPIILEGNRDEFRNFLIENRIYPPVHWPIPEMIGELDYKAPISLSKSILTIPCDQRYSTQDMDRIVNVIKDYFRR